MVLNLVIIIKQILEMYYCKLSTFLSGLSFYK